ncbi:MAG TPA: hypothetical protein VF735_03105, partial [Pyrinomonadaceae bacterium]
MWEKRDTMQLQRAHHTAKAHVTPIFGPLRRFPFMLLTTALLLTSPLTVPSQQPASTGSQEASKPLQAFANTDDSIRPFRV